MALLGRARRNGQSGVAPCPEREAERVFYVDVDADLTLMCFDPMGRATDGLREARVAVSDLVKSRHGHREQRPQSNCEREQRASCRIDLGVKVHVECGEDTHTALVANINAGGVFVTTKRLRKVGDRVKLRFRFPKYKRPLAVDAEVRWIREGVDGSGRQSSSGMGLQFVALPARTAASVSRLLEALTVS